jgi:tRNA (guanine37-N1)-methyltransferase
LIKKKEILVLKTKVYTIFPEMFPGFLGYSLTGKALDENLWSMETVNIRDYALDKHGSVDDTPCGGGAGMVMRADILGLALEANHTGGRIIAMSPKGRPLTQEIVKELSNEQEISVICGRFEGIDERVIEAYGIEEISIGDYILTGGEQAAQIMFDAIVRLLPGVLRNMQSTESESFENNLLEYPQYTRPVDWLGRKVPDILLSGHHKKIDGWRKEQSIKITKDRRPDLFALYQNKKV